MNNNSEEQIFSFDDLKKVLIDPWHVIVIDAICGYIYISTYGTEECEIIEQLQLSPEVDSQLSDLIDDGIIYYDSFGVIEPLAMPHFCDIWREYAYGPQVNSARLKAKELGLIE
jgi:hypothetical protein